MHLPEDLCRILDAVRGVGRPRLVGGGVRDWLLGLASTDYDIEVANVSFEELHRVARPDAKLFVRVAHGARDDAWQDPAQQRVWTEGSFAHFAQPVQPPGAACSSKTPKRSSAWKRSTRWSSTRPAR